jgi:ketosteroid isomerase-like protein
MLPSATVIRRVYSIVDACRKRAHSLMKYLRIVIAGVTICAGEEGGRFVKGLLCVALAAISLLFWPVTALAQTDKAAEGLPDVRRAIQVLDQQVNAAAVSGDVQTLGKVMSDDYVGVAPNGMILRKPMIAAHYQAGTLHYSSVVNSDVEIHVHDNCAVLTAIATVKGHDGDTDLSGTYRIMRVFLRRGGAWQIVAFQATPIHPPAPN